MSRPLSLALVQAADRRPDDLDGFADHVTEVARTFPGARLLVYPELHCEGLRDQRKPLDGAEPVGRGPRHERFSQLAGDLGVWLCPGSIRERDADGHVYNTAVVYSPQGDLVAAYRKVFPWRPFEQERPGSEFVVFDIPGLARVGLSICYDAWFPESTRHLAWMGAEVVLNLVKTGTVDRAQEIVIARANAIVNQVFVASVNAAAPSGVGHSLVVDPEGHVIAEAVGGLPGVLTAVIDLDSVSNARNFGTCGLTRMWSQFDPDDEPIPLPLYHGSIAPRRWAQTATQRRHESIAAHATANSAGVTGPAEES